MRRVDGNKCPECGGLLIYDEYRGELVCSRCGLVVDRVYDYGPLREREEVVERRELSLRGRPRGHAVAKKLRYKLRLYRIGRQIEASRPGLIIDYNKAFRQGRFVNTVTSINTVNAKRVLEEKGVLEDLEEIVRIIMEVDPAAMARTYRSKLAIAYIVHYMLTKGKYPNPRDTSRIFHISLTTYKRLEKVADRIYRKIVSKPIAREIIKIKIT